MNIRRNNQDYIDQYWNGEISEEHFQDRIKSDALLAREYEFYQRDLQVIRAGAKEQLRKKATLTLIQHEGKQTKIVQLKRVLAIAASFTLLVTGYLIFQNFGQPKSNSELFATHFELPAPANERNGTTQSKLWETAMIAYIHQDFEKMIDLLSPVIEQPDFPFTERGKLYLGISFLMINETQNAINIFKKINQESSYFPDAQWFVALTFLKMDKITEAQAAFHQIANQPRHFKRQEALEILENF